MVLTDDITLPSEEELTREEIPLTHNFFLSSAMWLGKYCDNQCKDFMLCRQELMDPRKCLDKGHKVTDCGLEFFKKVKKTCKEELEWYTKCLDFSGREPHYFKCRREQALFDGCMYESGFERAKFGHFQVLRIHDPDWERPKKHVPIFEDSVEHFDYTKPEYKEPPRGGLGGRKTWQVWFDR